jgi:hypothetical protein
MINLQDKEQSSERAINSREPPKPAIQDQADSPGAQWRAQASYSLAHGARK